MCILKLLERIKTLKTPKQCAAFEKWDSQDSLTPPTCPAPLETAGFLVTPPPQTGTFHFCSAIGKPSEAIDSIGRYTLIVSITCSTLWATCPTLLLEVRWNLQQTAQSQSHPGSGALFGLEWRPRPSPSSFWRRVCSPNVEKPDTEWSGFKKWHTHTHARTPFSSPPLFPVTDDFFTCQTARLAALSSAAARKRSYYRQVREGIHYA